MPKITPHKFDASGTELKRCSKCKVFRPIGGFSKNKQLWDGLSSACKECCALQFRRYYEKNKTQMRKRSRDYYNDNREYHNVKSKKYYKKNKKELRGKAKIYNQRKEVKDQKCKRVKQRLKEDPQFRLNANIRRSLHKSLKRVKQKKENRTFKYIGCTPECLLERLEKMRIERGLDASAHVDHMMPLDSFDLSDPEQLRRAWNISNLQLLSAEDNFKKSNKVIYDMKWCTKRDQWLIRNKDNKGPYRPTALFQSLLLV